MHLGDVDFYHWGVKTTQEPRLPLPEAVIFCIREPYILNKNFVMLKDQKFPWELPALQPEMKQVGCWAEGEKVPKGAVIEEECLPGPGNSLSAAHRGSPTARFAVVVKNQWLVV